MLDDKLKKQLSELTELYELAYKQIKPSVEYIIKNNIKDLNYIENILESLINIPTDKCYKLFIKLCDYTRLLDPQLVSDYMAIYENMYGKEETKERKRP